MRSLYLATSIHLMIFKQLEMNVLLSERCMQTSCMSLHTNIFCMVVLCADVYLCCGCVRVCCVCVCVCVCADCMCISKHVYAYPDLYCVHMLMLICVSICACVLCLCVCVSLR